ncbi:SP_1767 family glycosyltransferase [Clostridium baratii]
MKNFLKKIYLQIIKKNKISKKILYYFYSIIYKFKVIKVEVSSIDETLDKIINSNCSLTRFGDGELNLIQGRSINFQEYNSELALRLKNILKSNKNNILIAIPDVFNKLDDYCKSSREYWCEQIVISGGKWKSNMDLNKRYYNAFISRPYYIYLDKSNSEKRFKNVKKIWKNKSIAIVEGEQSKLGMGNDLFDECDSIERYICPSKNAYSVYEKILYEVSNIDKQKLVLIALGPTASVLAYDLSQLGFQAIDIGHIDIEYEWFLRKSKSKEKINGKYTNESNDFSIENIETSDYKKQIVKIIK